MPEDILNQIADVGVLVSFSLAAAFTILYMGFFNWRKTRAGRAILYLFVAWLGVTTISFLSLWLGPDYWLRPLWRVVGWGLVVFALVNIIRVLVWNWAHKEKALELERREPTGSVSVQEDVDDSSV